MLTRLLPELAYYRTRRERSRAVRIIAGQLRIAGLVLSPRTALIAGGGWVLLQVAGSFLLASRAGVPLTFAISSAAWALLAAVVLGSAIRRTGPALRRDLVRRGRRLCLSCGYDLGGIDGQCPECGAASGNLIARAWEPIAAMAMFPGLADCRDAQEAAHCLELARARAGAPFMHPRVTLAALLVLTMIFWLFMLRFADRMALHYRRDLPEDVGRSLVLAAIVSFILITGGWYGLVVRRVRGHIPRCIAEIRRREQGSNV